MRCGCLLIALALGLLFYGVMGIQEATNFRQPKTMTCAQFIQSPRSEGWFHLTGCSVELTGAVIKTAKRKSDSSESSASESDTGKLKSIYIPVYASPGVDHKQTPLMLESSDDSTRSIVEEMRALKTKNLESSLTWLEANRNRLSSVRDLTGMVRIGMNDVDPAKVSESPFAPGYVVFREGQTPVSAGNAILAMLGGGVMAVIAFLYWIQWARRTFNRG